jgi:ABC-2 type transport system permease protein
MFFHNFKNSLKVLLKNKSLIFWTFVFPLLLGTLFKMAFSNIEKSEKLEIIEIGIINDSNYNDNKVFTYAFNYLSDENNSDRLFNITYGTLDEMQELLVDESITGYLYLDTKPHIVIMNNGINESIFKYVVDEIYESSISLSKISDASIDDISKGASSLFSQEIKLNNISNKNLSYTMIEFYSLIAMTCLYGAILSMYSLNQVLPDMTNKGKRVSVAPVSKFKLILSSLSAGFITQVIGVMLLFVYSLLVLNVDFGSNLLLVILLTLVGSLSGLALGIFITTYFKGNENSKLGLIIGISMAFSFFAGMMGITMKYIIDKNVPIINQINPVSMITDGLYSLYYYDTYNRYIFDIVSLLIFSLVLILLSFMKLRRQKYDSI